MTTQEEAYQHNLHMAQRINDRIRIRGKQYKFFSDAGHGWLRVRRDDLVTLNLIPYISKYSYQHGDWVYLEEDCDATRFVDKILGHDHSKESLNAWFEAHVKMAHSDHSSIRNYDSFTVRHK